MYADWRYGERIGGDDMVRILVESVERKLDMKASVLVGNYEFYYAAGKLAALTGR